MGGEGRGGEGRGGEQRGRALNRLLIEVYRATDKIYDFTKQHFALDNYFVFRIDLYKVVDEIVRLANIIVQYMCIGIAAPC